MEAQMPQIPVDPIFSDKKPLEWKTLAYKPLYLLLADYVESRIVAGHFPKGAYLPTVREFMKLFHVSLATVRRALDLLQKQELISVVHGSGISVIYDGPIAAAGEKQDAKDVIHDVQDLFAARAMLETSALEMALPHIDADALLEQYQKTDTKSKLAILEIDEAMHKAIFNQCPNIYIREALARVMKQIELYREINRRKVHQPLEDEAYEMIGKIIRAMQKGYTAAAQRALKEHIDYTCKQFIGYVAEPPVSEDKPEEPTHDA
jgi:DNA-binding FadR family transcriptional regulator